MDNPFFLLDKRFRFAFFLQNRFSDAILKKKEIF